MKQFLVIVISLCFCDIVVSQIDDDILLYMPFDGDYLDYSNNPNAFEEYGTITYGADRHGTPNRASFFSGSDYLDVTTDTVFNELAAYTISFYCRPIRVTGANVMICKVTPGRDFVIEYTEGKFNNNHMESGAGGIIGVSSPTPSDVNEWYHIIYSYDGTTIKFYINGELVKSRTVVGEPSGTGGNMSIGAFNSSNWLTYQGYLDDLIIRNRALTEVEIEEQTWSVSISQSDSLTICIYDSTLLETNNNAPVTWYNLDAPGTPISIDSALWVSPIQTTDYRVFGSGGFSKVFHIHVDTSESCFPNITTSYQDTICQNSTTITAVGDTLFSWFKNDINSEKIGISATFDASVNLGQNTFFVKGSGDIDTLSIYRLPEDECQLKLLGDSILCEPQEIELKANPAGNYFWFNIDNPKDTMHIGASFSTFINGNTTIQICGKYGQKSTEFQIQLLPPEECNKAARIYDFFSPNGDGTNEVFFIPNISDYSKRTVRIYNHLNQLLFESTDYTNDWSGDDLPSGVYFYEVQLDDNTLSGPLMIGR